MGAAGAVLTLGIALGSPLGGALGELDPAYALLGGAAVMVVVAFLGWMLLSRDTVQQRAVPPRQIISTLYKFPALRLPFLFAFLDRFTVGFLVAGFPVYATLKYGFTPARIGLQFAAFMLTMGILCYPTTRLSRYFTLRQLMLGGSLVYSTLFAAVGFVGEGILLWWMILMGAASAVMFIPTLQLAARAVPDFARTTAMGGLNAAGALGFLLGPIVSGVLIAALKPAMGTVPAYSIILLIGGLTEFVIAGALLVFGWLKVPDISPDALAHEKAPA
jgi:MFS family permease